jgi:hypothetical protein
MKNKRAQVSAPDGRSLFFILTPMEAMSTVAFRRTDEKMTGPRIRPRGAKSFSHIKPLDKH